VIKSIDVPRIPPTSQLTRIEEEFEDNRKNKFTWVEKPNSEGCSCVYFEEACPLERKIVACYMQSLWQDIRDEAAKADDTRQMASAAFCAEEWKRWGAAK